VAGTLQALALSSSIDSLINHKRAARRVLGARSRQLLLCWSAPAPALHVLHKLLQEAGAASCGSHVAAA
jgi:hypothetical protein